MALAIVFYSLEQPLKVASENSWIKTDLLKRKPESSRSEVFLGKGFLKMCRKFTGEQPCWSIHFAKGLVVRVYYITKSTANVQRLFTDQQLIIGMFWNECAEFLNATEIKQLRIIRNMNNKYFNNL